MNEAPPGFIPGGYILGNEDVLPTIINVRSIDSIVERDMHRMETEQETEDRCKTLPPSYEKGMMSYLSLPKTVPCGEKRVIVTVGKLEVSFTRCSLVQFAARMCQAMEETR